MIADDTLTRAPDETGPEAADEARPLLLPGLTVEVFAESAVVRQNIRRAQRNQAFSRMKWRFREGGVDGAIAAFKDHNSADLLILESGLRGDELLPRLATLSEHCEANTRVLVIGSSADNEVELFRRLLKVGISDYLPAPADASKIIASVTDIYRDTADVRLGRVTAFIGAGGGTGSSSLAQNVAVAMAARMDTEVLLADLDPQYGTVGLNFDVEDAYSITDALNRGSLVDAVLIERITQKVSSQLGLITVAPGVDNLPELPPRAIGAILDLADTMPRHVVLDMSHVWTLRTKKTLCRADQIVITTMPTLSGLRNARALLSVMRRIRPMDAPPILVLNKVGLPRRLEVSLQDFRDALELDSILTVPYNARLFSRAQAQGESVIDQDERSDVAYQIIRLAQMINGQLDKGDPRSLAQRLAARLRKWW